MTATAEIYRKGVAQSPLLAFSIFIIFYIIYIMRISEMRSHAAQSGLHQMKQSVEILRCDFTHFFQRYPAQSGGIL
jgi:hypothetical protein